MTYLNGGYILLDFTKYDLTSDVASFDDIGDATEITKDEYDEILKKAKLSQDTCKPLIIKTNHIYDSLYQKNITASDLYYDGKAIAIPYVDIADSNNGAKILFLTMLKYNDKYYIFVSSKILVSN